MTTTKLMTTALILASLGAGSTLKANEKEEAVNFKHVPAAVQKAIHEKAAGGELVRIEKETEKGRTVFEAVIKKNGKETGYEFDDAGKSVGKPHDEQSEHSKKK